MRVAVIRNKPQTFVCVEAGDSLWHLCHSAAASVTVSPLWGVLQAPEVDCQQSHSETAFLQLFRAA